MQCEMSIRHLGTLALGCLLLIGIYVRYADLGTHFSHVDDIKVATLLTIESCDIGQSIRKINDISDPRYNTVLWKLARKANDLGLVRLIPNLMMKPYWVAHSTTYGPLQYFLTPLFLSSTHGYREALFWGRFPSFLCGIAALVLMLSLCQRLYLEEALPHQIMCLAILVFSWENIIYAKQMESYAIGVLAAVLMMILLISNLRGQQLTVRSMILTGIALALFCSAQYQMLFFLPAFFIVLSMNAVKAGRPVLDTLKRVFVCAAVTITLFLPVFVLLLREKTKGGLNWNVGPSREFLFSLPYDDGIIASIGYSLQFFIKNLFIVIQSTVAFLPEESVFYQPLTAVFVFLLIAGVLSLMGAQEIPKKRLFAFLFISSLTWGAMIVMGKLTLSPTRHTLILLPVFALCIAEGSKYISTRLIRSQANMNAHLIGNAILVGMMALAFFLSFQGMIAQRNDPFDEHDIRDSLTANGVNAVYQYSWTNNLLMMKSISGHIPVFVDFDQMAPAEKKNTLAMKQGVTVAFISHRESLPPDILAILDGSGYRRIFCKEIHSDTEICFSKRTQNGTNGLYFYIYQRS